MPTIITRRKDGTPIATVKSHLVVVHAGTQTYTLHLHNDPVWHWRLSDPRSGGVVLHVAGQFKGIRTSSKGFTLREIRVLAHQQVEALIERIGSDRFNSTLAQAPTGLTA